MKRVLDARTVMAQATLQERRDALCVGASVLQQRWPQYQVDCIVQVGLNSLHAHAVVKWCGVVCVTYRYSGELIAQSKPGKPFELDTAAT